jgi:hypothetical protein
MIFRESEIQGTQIHFYRGKFSIFSVSGSFRRESGVARHSIGSHAGYFSLVLSFLFQEREYVLRQLIRLREHRRSRLYLDLVA